MNSLTGIKALNEENVPIKDATSNYRDELLLNSKNSSKHRHKNSYDLRKQIQNKIAKYNFDDELGLTVRVKELLKDVDEYEFNLFALNKETNGNEMVILSTHVLHKHNLFENCVIDPTTYNNFITHIQNRYYDIAYHNKSHGTDVCRLAYYYAIKRNFMEEAKLSELDLCTLIISGAIHDFEHLGWNNAFLIETQHDWAITYNDISVCENHHVAAAFKIMKDTPGCNIYENLNANDFKEMRKKMTKIVISTDMALHFEHLQKMKDMLAEDEIDITKEDTKTFLMCMCLHVADLTNPTKLWMESFKWACLVYEEFFVQGDRELEIGLPVSKMTDRLGTNIATAQLGFIDFIIKPSFEVFCDYLPSCQLHLDQLIKNRQRWEYLVPE